MRKKLRRMRFLPLAFLIGAEGFALVAPYLIVFLALVVIIRNLQARGLLAA